MRSWVFSLQFRLVVVFAVILTLALGSVSYYVGLVAGREAERFELRRSEVRKARIERMLSRFFTANQEWTQLQPFLERAGGLTSKQIVVRNPHGEVVGDSHRSFGGRIPWEQRGLGTDFTPVVIDGQEVGSFAAVAINPSSEGPGFIREPPISRLVSALNRYLLWTGLAAGAVGILLVSLISRWLLAPMQALGSAATRLGGGDLSQRVSTSGPSEIGKLANSFNTMAGNLQQAEEQRRNLVADVAHELRTPLTNIQGYLEAVKDGLLEPTPDTIDTIHQQALHLSGLVEDLRLLAQAEGGALRLNLEPDSLDEVVNRSVTAFQTQAKAKGVKLSLSVSPGIPLVVMDRTRIAQVVDNLLDNAIHHTPEGGMVNVHVEMNGPETARVTVEDAGEGIAPEDISLVFERFYRVDSSRSRATGGVGLGLTIAKKLVEAHDGAIYAESTPGKGSRFAFDLPLANGREQNG
ncbi:MAG: HAMP domain-containing histidine kinase [Chloroflexi bacterium]|nr:HAMP domain-containing histidine kinase [Chloroflexota bacterium]